MSFRFNEGELKVDMARPAAVFGLVSHPANHFTSFDAVTGPFASSACCTEMAIQGPHTVAIEFVLHDHNCRREARSGDVLNEATEICSARVEVLAPTRMRIYSKQQQLTVAIV